MSTAETGGPVPAAPPQEQFRALPITSIRPNRFQPRETFEQTGLDALAASIKTAGVMQPIVVRPVRRGARGNGDASYEIIAGERRYRAVLQLGLDSIPAIVRDVDDRTAAEWALIENLQREDLNPMERAAAFRRLIEEFGMTQQSLAEQVGLDRTTIANLLRLNDLDAKCAGHVRAGRLSFGHAKALLGCSDPIRRGELADTAVREAWSVRRTEHAVAAVGSGRLPVGRAPSGLASPTTLHVESLERRIGEQLGTRVHIQPGRTKGAGRLLIEYYSLDQFEGLLRRMGISD